ncbi:MAG: histidine kinase [Eggerthellaceae bacterium]|nr:histidine kinase [Eggerthellaceae bacterium]
MAVFKVGQKAQGKSSRPRFFTLEMVMFSLAVLSGVSLLWELTQHTANIPLLVGAGAVFTLSLILVIRLLMDPDSVRARQTDAILTLANQTLACTSKGLDTNSAQRICDLLLPSTAANAVAITDKENILGYTGADREMNQPGSGIRTQATLATVRDGRMRVLLTPEEIGFPEESANISAAIIVPLTVGASVAGVLKFYYHSAKDISDAQKSIAEGFGLLLSTQMAAAALEKQTKLATSMELKALQSQINPHFLFNTINTIASLVRTDPEKARMLLREFAVFYRRTLEDSDERILFGREIEQTLRYFSFEVARFGEDRIGLDIEIDPEVEEIMIPPFLVQPLVENAVRHALPSEGKLEIQILGMSNGGNAYICVKDNGVGMSEETCKNILAPRSVSGLGIAVGNVHDRVKGFFGSDAYMEVESRLGVGTAITLVLVGVMLPAGERAASNFSVR